MMYTAKAGVDVSGAFPSIDETQARIGVIDVGSNSIRMVIYDGATRSPAVYFNEKVFCGLGEALTQTGKLSPQGRERALGALARFKAVADGVDQLRVLDVVATAAVREAEDGQDFIDQVERETGLRIRVASGADEARLAAQGVLVGEPRANGVVADIGGASMELVDLADGSIGQGVTTPLGPLRLAGLKGAALKKSIDEALDNALDIKKGKTRFGQGRTLFIVGGSFRAIVRAYMTDRDYPLRVLQGFSLTREDALEMAEWAASLSPERYSDLAGASDGRAAVAPVAAQVLARLIKHLRPADVVLSNFGLREGVLLEHLPRELRLQDPLIQPCEAMERADARRPGFGVELWSWLQPAMPDFDAREARLAQAACLISDVTWRTQAEFRAQADFELVTRNNFGSIDHAGRVFIGVALLHQHKDGRKEAERQPASKLLSRTMRHRARALGRGVRLGALLGAASATVLAQTRLSRSGDTLFLHAPAAIGGLLGEEVEKRLRALADALDLSQVEIVVG